MAVDAEQEVPMAPAEDPAAATGTHGDGAKNRNQLSVDLAKTGPFGYAAARMRTIGTSFLFSGSSRSSVRPRYVSLFR